MFDFMRATVLCLERRFSKHEMTKYAKNVGGWAGADTGGMHPPTRPKEVLIRHLISLKIIAKILPYCTLLAKDAKINSC